jgi:putative membrane protein
MIVREKPSKLDLILALRGSIVPIIAADVLGLSLVAAALVWIDSRLGALPHLDATSFTVFGIALSLFLGFRNNAAYERWWEARKLWGGLLADIRSFARESAIFVADERLRKELVQTAMAFLHLHRISLRNIPVDESAGALVSEFASAPDPPGAALDSLAKHIGASVSEGKIDGFGARSLSERLANMTLQQAGCERIASTPLPYVYSLLIYRTTYLYCLVLPLALFDTSGWMTPLFVAIVAYVFLGLAEVTEELSHPFGTTPNGLPLDAICRTAERAVAGHLDATAPEPLEADRYYLS